MAKLKRIRMTNGAGWLALCAALMGSPAIGSARGTAYSMLPALGHAAVAAQPTGGQTKVTLSVQDSSLLYVVRELARQAHLHLVFTGGSAFAQRVSVHLVDVGVMDAYARVLRGKGIVARLAPDEETVVISTVAKEGQGKGREEGGGVIAGQVTDSATGVGLNGAQVRIEGVPKLTAVTADSGRFTLHNVPPGDQVVQVRLFGYRPANRTITVVDGERTTVRVALTPVPTVLSGVVTTATGVQRKVEVGNDITTLNVDSVMKVAPVSTVTDLLETRVPGLTVQHTSGVPGNPSRIRIRGVSSITGNNDPIIVIDGIRAYSSQSDPRNDNLAPSLDNTATQSAVVSTATGVSTASNGIQLSTHYAAPSPLDQLDPNSIETIEVLKGPSASALYGSDAANGVIVVTTKHGRAGPTHWSLALGQGTNWLPGNWPTHYFKFGTLENQLNPVTSRTSSGYCVWYDPYCVRDSLVAFQALNDPRFSPFTHGSDQTAALTISGGVPTLQYNLTGSAAGTIGNLKLPVWEQQRLTRAYGAIPNWMARPDKYSTYGVSGQLTAQPTAQTRVTLQSSLFQSDQQQGSLQQALSQLEGEYISVVNDSLVRLNAPNATAPDFKYSPLVQNEVERATSSTLTAMNSLTLSWQPWSWLPLTATGGLQTIQRNDQTYIPYGIGTQGVPACRPDVVHPQQIDCLAGDTTGSYGLGRGTSESKTLNLNSTIPSRWVSTAVGLNVYSQSTNDFSAYTSQLAPGVSTPTQFLYANNTGPTLSTNTGSTYGWFVQPTLNFNSRFFASPGFRLDGGSAVGAHGGFGGTGLTGFPKIDFSWLAIDRDQPRGPLSLLRPRLAFGYAGTQPGPTQKLRLLNEGGGQPIVLNDSITGPGVVLSELGNTTLRPETSRELEGGLDAEVWRGRLIFTWTQVNKTRYNAIIAVPISPSVGSTAGLNAYQQYVNVGTVRNTGTELTWNAAVLESRALGWQVGGNFSTDNNRVVQLAPGFQTNKLLGIVPGYPLFSQWARPIVGFVDENQDHLIEPGEYFLGDSAVYVGQAEPKYQLDLNSTLTLLDGRLSVNATFSYQDGMTQNNLTALQSAGVALLPNAPGTSLGTQAAFMAALCAFSSPSGCIPGTQGNGTSVGLLQTVNTFRFNALSVNYTLPTGLTHWLRVPHASLALQGSNLGLHTNYRGFDPNVNAFSTSTGGDQTADLGQLPQPRTWWLKLNLGN